MGGQYAPHLTQTPIAPARPRDVTGMEGKFELSFVSSLVSCRISNCGLLSSHAIAFNMYNFVKYTKSLQR